VGFFRVGSADDEDKRLNDEALQDGSGQFRTTMEGGLGTTPEPPFLRSCQRQQRLGR
jgi:hypothetical protein